MNIKQLLSDDEGVSPVIGVILMVAITVILAAVIAAFVLGLGDSDDVAPQTTFDFDYDEDPNQLTVTASSGDTIDADQLTLSLDGLEFDSDNTDLDDDGDEATWNEATDGAQEEVSAGSSVTLDENILDGNDGFEDDASVTLVWESDDGDDSSILASFDGPEA